MTASVSSLLTAAIPLLCAALLVAAAATDLAARIIPNRIPLLLLALGLVLHLAQGTLIAALLVAALVFALLLVAWHFGAMGGGDVKLLAATAFCVAPVTVPLLIMRVGLAGGVLGIAYLVARRAVRAPVGAAPRGANRSFAANCAALPARVLRAERWRIGRHAPLPYGIAIAVGGLLTLI
jgi:Flp pilus assembly protein protease CpaA